MRRAQLWFRISTETTWRLFRMITIIRIIECGASQLSRGGIRRGTWRFQSSTCDSDFATYDFPVAPPRRAARGALSPRAGFSGGVESLRAKGRTSRTTIRRRKRVRRVGVRTSSFNRSHPFLRLAHFTASNDYYIRESCDFRNCNCARTSFLQYWYYSLLLQIG